MQATAQRQEVVAPEHGREKDAERGHLVWPGPGAMHQSVPTDALSMMGKGNDLDNGDPPDLMLWGEE